MDKMDSIAIDPELFMLCRLCTDEKGMFQIVPKVQMQFKECFDITVEQFDGLSQLVCGKCKEILNNFNEMKKKFQEKQNILISRRTLQISVKEADGCLEGNTHREPSAEENKLENLPVENDTVSSTKCDEPIVTQISTKPKAKSKKKVQKTKLSLKIKLRTKDTEDDLSISDFNLNTTNDVDPAPEKKEREVVGKCKNVVTPKWEANYLKKFNCRLCSKVELSCSFIAKHMETHQNLINRKKNLIKRECVVSLARFDGKLNFTGNNSVTIFSPSLLLEGNIHCNNNFITYVPKSITTTNANDTVVENLMGCLSDASTVELDSRQRKRSESMIASDKNSSEDENFLRKSKRTKRNLLLSTSESEGSNTEDPSVTSSPIMKTTKRKRFKCNDSLDVLQEKSVISSPESKKKEIVNTDQQPLSSLILKPNSLENDTPKKDVQEKNKTKFNEFKPIRNIITMAFQRMNRIKNKEDKTPSKNDVDLLNKKLLSIGRKVMSKSGYTSIGLLKYLAKRNLHIAWTDHLRTDTKTNRVGNKVRIMTRAMIDDTDNLQGFIKSTSAEESASLDITMSERLLRTSGNKPSKQVEPLRITDGRVKTVLESLLMNKLVNNQEPSRAADVETEEKQQDTDISTVCTDKTDEANETATSREASAGLLLNKSPATNPKPPFRKKCVENKTEELGVDCIESASLSKCVNLNRDHDYESTTSVFVVSSDDEAVNDSVHMPIIASTTSLAPNTNNPINDVIKHADNSTMPRIKCKPVTDLMPEKIYHHLNMSPRADMSSAAKIQTVVNKFSPMDLIPPSGVQRQKKDNPMIFHTMLLPNTHTYSPFTYFKSLLGLHALKLIKPMDGNSSMRSLVKFTLVVQQHPIATEMCLDLMAHITEFCIRVTNNDTIVNIKEMAAAWQWEVLKAFKAEKVYSRAIECAEKINNKTCYNTKLFFNVLTSIQVKPKQ